MIKNKKLKILIKFILLLLLCVILYFVYAIFINPLWKVELPKNISKEEISTLRTKIIKIDENDFKNLIKYSRNEFHLIQFWQYNADCSENFDSNFIYTFKKHFPNITYILISTDLNATNFDIILAEYLKRKKVEIKTYIINKPINILDLKNINNLNEFMQNIFNNYKNFRKSKSLIFLIDKERNILTDFQELMINSDKYFFNLSERNKYIFSTINNLLKNQKSKR